MQKTVCQLVRNLISHLASDSQAGSEVLMGAVNHSIQWIIYTVTYVTLCCFILKWQCQIFVGVEYPAVVEYAPYQGVPKKKAKKDPKVGTILEGGEFKWSHKKW